MLPLKKEHMETQTTSFYDISLKALDGSDLNLADFKGKHLLFVNVASKCGFTPQYKELQKLSDMYTDNLVVIGCPCNQFGGQEPGDANQIQGFCELNFGVTFPLTEKLDAKGSNLHPLYKWLTSKELNGKKNSSVKWNFQKYLVSPEGELIDYYYSITKPSSKKITKHL
ncbi:glutathione peroxidase [Croceivirga thetidis]|uniref:Glutathione peroxidase n=1 Tax=Croceivirga thetidis TaxID=2721623 RepID=A0ABX1GQ68_9FLAO|nr:glutathione peroxidase [Croceivirga thetidis]NKI31769.1 glutathione peroxidase [Croceivirga thetidis]